MAVRSTFLLLVFASLLAFNECSRSIGIGIGDNELDRNATAGSKITLSKCIKSYFGKWCCLLVEQDSCFRRESKCLSYCPDLPPPRARP
ncbi:hypothetical protein HRI_002418100 [Hibiscus trionum]|uniref:Uncharacterized protein n=1 Tax=Hibiscus trionum TaxID=183268 RepID=A0A9W7I3J6_HIBTR|nr:hypothetical protein HRI_002418100 [Hibiscus trionum]